MAWKAMDKGGEGAKRREGHRENSEKSAPMKTVSAW